MAVCIFYLQPNPHAAHPRVTQRAVDWTDRHAWRAGVCCCWCEINGNTNSRRVDRVTPLLATQCRVGSSPSADHGIRTEGSTSRAFLRLVTGQGWRSHGSHVKICLIEPEAMRKNVYHLLSMLHSIECCIHCHMDAAAMQHSIGCVWVQRDAASPRPRYSHSARAAWLRAFAVLQLNLRHL